MSAIWTSRVRNNLWGKIRPNIKACICHNLGRSETIPAEHMLYFAYSGYIQLLYFDSLMSSVKISWNRTGYSECCGFVGTRK